MICLLKRMCTTVSISQVIELMEYAFFIKLSRFFRRFLSIFWTTIPACKTENRSPPLPGSHYIAFSHYLHRNEIPTFQSRATRLYSPLCRFVRPTICWSVCHSFSGLTGISTLLLLPKYSTDLKYNPCPPARNWGSRVYGLVLSTCKNKTRQMEVRKYRVVHETWG